MDEDDLLGAEQPLRYCERADLVLGDDASGVSDDVSLAFAQSEHGEEVHAAVHARDDRQPASGSARQRPLLEARRVLDVVGDERVGTRHRKTRRHPRLETACEVVHRAQSELHERVHGQHRGVALLTEHDDRLPELRSGMAIRRRGIETPLEHGPIDRDGSWDRAER